MSPQEIKNRIKNLINEKLKNNLNETSIIAIIQQFLINLKSTKSIYNFDNINIDIEKRKLFTHVWMSKNVAVYIEVLF